MIIAIISDTHDNLANTKKCAQFLEKEKIKTIIHCGDIFKPETIQEILKFLKAKIHIIFTPADASFSDIPKNSFDGLKGVRVYENFGEITADGKKIAFCHFPEVIEQLAKTKKYDLIFYGHTHKPWLAKTGKTKIINPGNLANLFYKATFALYDTKKDKLELKILEKL